MAEAAGAPIAGGHSIDSAEPIYGLVALGMGHPDKLLLNSNAQAGDVLIVFKDRYRHGGVVGVDAVENLQQLVASEPDLIVLS